MTYIFIFIVYDVDWLFFSLDAEKRIVCGKQKPKQIDAGGTNVKRNICLCICMIAILLTSCNNSELQNISDNNDHGRIEEEEQEKWEVTDASGNKQVLDISNVMEMNQEVDMKYIYYPAEYAQVSDGHYYYMTYADRIYTIFMDHGTKIGNFSVKDGYVLEGCAKYKDKFYVTYCEENENSDEEVMEFGWIDFENKTVQHLYTEKMDSIR